ncbi:ribosomal protein L7/L12 [Chitinophaga rhizophila]|uniref:Ribosomal protein L7/L12 n=1 Tax=Chitinophaga rhizophila TaxID=2866212 RepID=A0ABS7GML1_9BACT|nr:ribosomal protein L7/L12 [Chitinophaga rhizophila]MBW8688097.1 ribosomal protein L7/L12 [Chitinophaga rhizophila]
MKKLLIFLPVLFACSLSQQEKGKLLSDKYCGSCHMPVAPAMLDKITWTEHVLPAMAPKLGIGVWQGSGYYVKPGAGTNISIEDWNAIVAYYQELAPDKLTPAKIPQPLAEDLQLFDVQPAHATDSTYEVQLLTIGETKLQLVKLVRDQTALSLRESKELVDAAPSTIKTGLSKEAAADLKQQLEAAGGTATIIGKQQPQIATTTMVAVDPYTGSLYSSAEYGASLYKWDSLLHPQPLIRLQSTAVDMNWRAPGTALLTCIGSMRAVDIPQGMLWEVYPDKPEAEQVKTIGMGLPRPVQSIAADFNKDGRTDYLVCGFGHDFGGLYVLQQTAAADYKKQPVWEVPGAIHSVVEDFDKDGWPDIMTLFAYGDEGLWLFLNDHKGGFTQKRILRFPPVYGSTSFQVVDMNKDGLPDILYTSGDNGDFSMELKPFHGVYIYLNKGDFEYEQSWFYPVNGCTKAIAADFDGDGDQDIASIAFFADLKDRPAEKFILFRQDGAGKYSPHTISQLKDAGRWICMDAGDIDRDGDLDIVLGSYSRGFIIQEGVQPGWDVNMPLVVLRNNSK